MLSPISVILYESLMDVSSAMTLMSGQNNLTWFATELSKQAPHWSCQPRVTLRPTDSASPRWTAGVALLARRCPGCARLASRAHISKWSPTAPDVRDAAAPTPCGPAVSRLLRRSGGSAAPETAATIDDHRLQVVPSRVRARCVAYGAARSA